MCIFQSEQVIKSMPRFHWKKIKWPRPPNSPVLNPLDYHVWDPMLGCYQKYTPKPTNIAELNYTALLNDLPQVFIGKAILSFQKRLNFHMLLQLVDNGHCEDNIQFKKTYTEINTLIDHWVLTLK